MKKKRKIHLIFSTILLLLVLAISFIDNIQPSFIVSEKKEEKEVKGNVTLSVLNQEYQHGIKEGDSVYDLMKNLENQENSIFTFKAKEYPSLGYFIEEINGVRGKTGSYWIYYINGEESSVGVSQYVLHDGDIINWKQE